MQFWGTPKLEAYQFNQIPNLLDGTITDLSKWVRLEKSDFAEDTSNGYKGDKDMYDVLKVVDKLVVYPTLSFRIGFRCF